MEKQYEKKITWTIKNFSSLQSEKIYSDPFVVGDSKWRLTAYPKGCGDSINKCLSLFLSIADSESLPSGWKRHAKYRLTVVNHISEKLSKQRVGQHWFDHKSFSWGYTAILPLTKLVYQNDGFLVNGEVKIVAEFDCKESSSSRSMEKQYEKKITWTIKNFSSLQSERVYSDNFVVGDSKWRLLAFPKGCGEHKNKSLSMFLSVADSESLPDGWKRRTKYSLAVFNQISEELSQHKGLVNWFDQKSPSWGFREMIPLTQLLDINGGFLVNGEVKIVAKVGVLEVVGKSDVVEETLLVNESVECNGFQVLPSQVESVNSLFEEHPDIASEIRVENPRLRTTYLNSLLTLSEILCQSPEKLSNNDLANAHSTLSYLTKTGFKLDWLEKKLKEAGETRLQQLEEELKDFKQKFS